MPSIISAKNVRYQSSDQEASTVLNRTSHTVKGLRRELPFRTKQDLSAKNIDLSDPITIQAIEKLGLSLNDLVAK